MKIRAPLIIALGLACASAPAATLPPEKLLPAGTLLVATIPDFGAWQGVATNSPLGRLWSDPAMKPFRDKFQAKFNSEVVSSLEHTLGIKFADYAGLAQGQITLGVVSLPAQGAEGKPSISYVLLIDAKDHSGQLATNLSNLKKSWIDAGKIAKTEKVRDVELTTLMISGQDLAKFAADGLGIKPSPVQDETAPPKDAEPAPVVFCQKDSLLLVSDSSKCLEKVLATLGGGTAPSLGENADFQRDYAAHFRNAQMYVWADGQAAVRLMLDSAPAADANADAGPAPRKLLGALGFTGIRGLGLCSRDQADGALFQFFVDNPVAERQGIFKVLTPDQAESGPPPFVPADVERFSRWRLNVGKSFENLQSMLNDLSPTAGMMLNMAFQAARQKDEHYDLKAELFGNVGNDIITYQKSARDANNLADSTGPLLYLIGSPKPDRLAAAAKVVAGLVLPNPAGLKEREFVGRTIYTATPPATLATALDAPKGLSFAASGNYLALSADSAILEEYLRGSGESGKSLAAMPGLAEAAQKVGGLNSGCFSYANSAQAMRVLFDVLRKNSGAASMTSLFLGATTLPPGTPGLESLDRIKDWADFSLLPSFDQVVKYFSYGVNAMVFDDDGVLISTFAPTPPQMNAK